VSRHPQFAADNDNFKGEMGFGGLEQFFGGATRPQLVEFRPLLTPTPYFLTKPFVYRTGRP
jgi:hypothetical protein